MAVKGIHAALGQLIQLLYKVMKEGYDYAIVSQKSFVPHLRWDKTFLAIYIVLRQTFSKASLSFVLSGLEHEELYWKTFILMSVVKRGYIEWENKSQMEPIHHNIYRATIDRGQRNFKDFLSNLIVTGYWQ